MLVREFLPFACLFTGITDCIVFSDSAVLDLHG